MHVRAKFGGLQEVRLDGRIVVWTDGSAFGEGNERRAGGGVYYGEGNTRNRAVPVGGVRTSQRSELAAVVYAVREDGRALVVRTDSRYVADGVNIWLGRWRARGWFSRPCMASYMQSADLWYEMDRLLACRVEPVRVEWVKGHATMLLVDQGVVTEQDAWGNGGADWVSQYAARNCNQLALACSVTG